MNEQVLYMYILVIALCIIVLSAGLFVVYEFIINKKKDDSDDEA